MLTHLRETFAFKTGRRLTALALTTALCVVAATTAQAGGISGGVL
jgi:hypothetical protein